MRSKGEGVYIESSINSLRMSFLFRKSDEISSILANKILKFIQLRAESFIIVRRKPILGWDFTFLVTLHHLRNIFQRELLINFIIDFIDDIARFIAEQSLVLNIRGKAIAREWLSEFQ